MGKQGRSVIRSYEDLKEKVETKLTQRETIINSRQKIVIPRKYHMTPEELVKKQQMFAEMTQDVPEDIKLKAGSNFFNPYRAKGAYYGSIQALYLLGSNEYHEESVVIFKMQEIMSTLLDLQNKNSWDKFNNRPERRNKDTNERAISTKDMYGRVQHNMRVLQRLGGIHPYGYKLKQLCSCIDIQCIKTIKGPDWYYQLNTGYSNINDVEPSYKIIKQ